MLRPYKIFVRYAISHLPKVCGVDRTHPTQFNIVKCLIFSPNYQLTPMTKTEILQALKQMTTDERLEIIEAASIMMREEIAEKAKRKAEIEEKLAAAVQDDA